MVFKPHNETVDRLLIDAQQTMMSNWVAMIQSASNTSAPFNQHVFTNIADVWRETVQSGIRLITMNADPTVRDVAEKIYVNQLNTLRFIELTSQVWTQVGQAIEQEANWQAVLDHELARIRRDWIQSTRDSLHIDEAFPSLWQAFIEEGCALSILWTEDLKQALLDSQHRIQHKLTNAADMASVHWDTYAENVGQLLTTPGLADLQSIHDALQHSFAVWLDMLKAMEAYHIILIDAWLQAYHQLIAELGNLAQAGEAVEGIRDFLNRWGATADDTFKQTFQSQPFVSAQTQLVNTIMIYRRRQHHLNDALMELYGLPTRTEVDEAHRRIYELRKEMKALKRQMKALRRDSDRA